MGFRLLESWKKGHPFFFQHCQLFPALPAFSSVASFFRRCQLFPALQAFSTVTVNSGFCWPSARVRRKTAGRGDGAWHQTVYWAILVNHETRQFGERRGLAPPCVPPALSGGSHGG